jgi:hypothetical protein
MRRGANVRNFAVRSLDGTSLGTIEMTNDGPAGKRYVETLRNPDGVAEGRVYVGDDELAARAAIEDAIGNICEGAAMWRERRKSVLH